jgi:hypothetical protein
MTNGIAEFGSVQCVEMEIADTASIEFTAHFGRDCGSNQLACSGMII